MYVYVIYDIYIVSNMPIVYYIYISYSGVTGIFLNISSVNIKYTIIYDTNCIYNRLLYVVYVI